MKDVSEIMLLYPADRFGLEGTWNNEREKLLWWNMALFFLYFENDPKLPTM